MDWICEFNEIKLCFEWIGKDWIMNDMDLIMNDLEWNNEWFRIDWILSDLE